MRTALIWTTLAVAAAVSPRAAADDVELAQRLMNEAHVLARNGDPRGALRKLDEAYAAAPRLSILFNKGTVYVDLLRAGRARADDLHQAVTCFERYAESGSEAAKREIARARLQEVKKALAAMQGPTPPPPPLAKKPPPKSTPAGSPSIAPAPAGGEVVNASGLLRFGLRADGEARFATHVSQGIALSRRGDRDGAVAEFVTAHDLIPRPDLLREAGDESMLGCAGKKPAEGDSAGEALDDLGVCYKRASDFYRRYLESTGMPPDRPDVERKIRDADEKSRSAENDAKAARAAQAAKKEERRGLYLKLAISSEVLAGVTTAVAITLFVVGKMASDELLAITGDGQEAQRQSKLSAAQWLYALGGGTAVLSALLSAGGGVLFWNARPSPGNRLSVWIVPVGAGFMVGGRF